MNVRQHLVETAEDMLRHLEEGSITQADGVMTRPGSIYTDVEHFELEKKRLFRRVPLMLAASCELPEPGDYKTIDVADIPVLITRRKDGTVRAFLNACMHRGAKLATGCGHAQRLSCPYHAWTYDMDGRLLAITAKKEFGELDMAANSLVSFPVTERAGLIWVILDPKAEPEFDAFFQGFDEQIAEFGFENWHYFESRVLPGANWKLAFDAHMDFYHLPVLHRNTFGAQISNLAQYYFTGPHQRLGLISKSEHILEMDDIGALAGLPKEDWPMNALLFGEWIIFPNVSINCFYKGGRGVIISQIFPGETVGESVTIQMFLHEKKPEGDLVQDAREMSDFLGRVVGEEDLPMSREQQKVFDSGLLPKVQFGRNEGGLQQYHLWLDRFMDAPEDRSVTSILS